MVTKMTGKEKKVERKMRIETFRKYYATNINCGLTNHDIRIELMNEKLMDEKGTVTLVESLIILSPVAAKKLLEQLSEIVKVYEQENGEIKINEDKNTY